MRAPSHRRSLRQPPVRKKASRNGANGRERVGQIPPVIALGGSAGCFDGLNQFFLRMPNDSGFAFILALHFSPYHESQMPRILARQTKMAVLHPRDLQLIEPNHVYVIPPGWIATIENDRIKLANLEPLRGIRMLVDILFSSVADNCGRRAAAVLFSGADADGANGIKRIKQQGGLTIVQDPSEVIHREMPNSAIATGRVDAVLPASEIPARLTAHFETRAPDRLIRQGSIKPRIAAPVKMATASAIVAELRARTGHDFSGYHENAILRHAARQMRLLKINDAAEYLAFLQKDTGEANALARTLMVSVTSFFRDPAAFAVLGDSLLEVFANKTRGDFVRVWVPGCSTGEEAYSIAMLLLEYSGKLDEPPAVQVFGCDVDAAAIEIGRAGIYPESIAKSVNDERLRRFFSKEPRGYRIRRELRQAVLFAVHDVVKDTPFAQIDLISCRNLLIYLSPEAKKRLVEIFHFALRPSGLLFLGSSEGINSSLGLFETVDLKYRLYRQQPNGTIGGHRYLNSNALVRLVRTHQRGLRTRSMAAIEPPTSSLGQMSHMERLLAEQENHLRLTERLAPAYAIVDPEHYAVYLSAKMTAFLKTSGDPMVYLPDVIEPSMRTKLRSALKRVGKNKTRTTLRTEVPRNGSHSRVKITITPAIDLAPSLLLVVFEPVAVEAALSLGKSAEVIGKLQLDAETLQRQLHETREQSARDRADLQGSNQEQQIVNQELRAATEELEINRQELQSINEELSAVNQELSINLDELSRANRDLDNYAAAMPAVFLDKELRVVRFTPSASKIFNLLAGDVGRPLAHFCHSLEYPNLIEDLRRVLKTAEPNESEVRDNSGRWFIARMQPYRDPEKTDEISGTVVTLVNITERKRAEEALEEELSTMTGLHDLADRLLSITDLPTALGNVLDAAISLFKADRGTVQIHDAQADILRYAASRGFDENMLRMVPPIDRDFHSTCAAAIRTGRRVVAADISSDPQWADHASTAATLAYKAAISAPMKTRREDLQGVITVHFREPHAPTDRDLRYLDLYARLGAHLVERSRAEQALRESEAALCAAEARELADTQQLQEISGLFITDDNDEKLYSHILEASMAIMSGDFASFQVVDEERHEMRLIAWRNFHPKSAKFWETMSLKTGTSCGAAFRGGDRVVIPDVQVSEAQTPPDTLRHYQLCGIRAVQSTPVTSRDGRLIGVISTHWREVHSPSEKELRLLDVLARQAADFFERRRTQEALQKSERRLQRMSETEAFGLIYFDMTGTVVFANEAFRKMTGYTEADVASRTLTWRTMTPPEFVAVSEAQLEKLNKTGKIGPYDKEYICKDGTRRWMRFAGRDLGDGTIGEFCIDITEGSALKMR
jgi:PAS domain S-box-containing protein